MKTLVTPAFIGRREELKELDAALAAVSDGSGRCVLIRGEAGVGKSRLIAELRAHAVASDFTVWAGRCFDQDRSFPYAPLIDMLRSFIAADDAVGLLAEVGPLAQPLVTLLPELATYLAGQPLPPPLDGESERQRLFAALTALLLQQAERGPLLVIVEDLHWSDEVTLAFLLYLLRRIAAHRLFLVLSARRDHGPAVLTALLTGLDREPVASELALEPLTRAEVAQLLQAILDQAETPSAAFVDAIYTLSEGNPFFAEEICTSLIASGDVFYEKDQWRRKPLAQMEIPDSLLRVVQQRLERLSAPARALIDLAAVSGRSFDFSVLQALSGQGEAELLALVKELLAARLLVEESADQFAFRHALTREALYGRLLARERQTLHAQLVRAIEAVHAGALESQLEALSYHAFAGALWPQTLAYAQQAGEKALALYAPQAATAHFTRALNAAAQLGIRPPATLYRQRGEAFDILGDFDQARADYEQGLDAARESGDEKVAWRALLDLGLLWAARDYERTGAYCREALAVARRMEDPAAVAHSLNRLGNWMMNSGQPVAALDYHREALELFEELDDQAGIATTLDLLAMTSNQCGDAMATVAYYERAVPILRALNDRQTLASSLTMLSLYKLDEALGREAVALAREIEWRSGEAYALSYLGSLLAYKGDLGQGLRVAASGRSLAEAIDHRLWLSWAEIVLGLIYLELLAPEEARRHLLPARDLAQEVGSTFMIDFAGGLLASTYLMLGRRDEAAALLPVQMVGEVVGGQYTLAKAFVEQALADDDPVQALQRLDQLTLPAQAHWLGGITTFYGALVALRAEALRRLARLDEAEAELQAMVALYQQQGTLAGLWRLHLGLGKVYQDQGNVARAEAAFAAARARIAALADTVPDEALREQFRRRARAQIPPVRSLTPRQAAKVKYGGLTRREREVAAIVAGGLTNQEIADELVVSIKTVEAHVTRILSKLGFSSRAQIAAWAVDKGLASAPQDLDSLTRDDRSEPHDAVP